MTFLPVFQVDDVKKKVLWLANGHTVTVWLWDILIPKIKWNRHHSASFFAVKCRKNGHFHSFSVCWRYKTAVKGGKWSNSISLTLRHIHAKIQVKLLSFSVIFCWKNGHFHSFPGCWCSKTAVTLIKRYLHTSMLKPLSFEIVS